MEQRSPRLREYYAERINVKGDCTPFDQLSADELRELESTASFSFFRLSKDLETLGASFMSNFRFRRT
jgi:hypothetical protein